MKKIVFLIVSLPVFAFGQTDKNPCETLARINALIQQQHYRPKPIDDSLSVFVFDDLLKQLDDDNRLFTLVEINDLKKHKYKIDDYIKDRNCDFLTDFYKAYTHAIERYARIIEALKEESFPLKSTETIQFSKKAFPYVKDETELKKLYKKRVLFHILKDISEVSQNKDSLLANFDKISKTSKDKVFDTFSCKSAGFQLSSQEFNSKFFNAVCSYFDPHTEYFSQSDRSSFLTAVSADNLTFGMMISMNEKDEIIVDEVIPGSSAYYTEKIDGGDQIIKIKYHDEEYNIACSSMQKVEAIFSSSEYKNVEFTLRKKSGEVYNVNLTKRVMKDYNNNVYSYILNKDTKKIGYVRIPSFYGKIEDGKTNMSDDVIKEIYKLQEDKIEGLIIDLQNNGGGSMDEAVKLSGAFIEAGPVAIMNNRRGQTQTLKDPNRGSVYTGPLVVLINGFSASASEFFSNAMQDYNRAVVIGSQSYGKASMQRIFPLTMEDEPSEFVKLTIEEFYRITGKTNQTIGIKPDVEIPSLFEGQMPKEGDNKTALKNDMIEAAPRFTLFTNPLKPAAIENSRKRISASTDAKMITDMNVKIDQLYDGVIAPVTLEFNSVFAEVNRMNSLWKDIKDLSEKEYPINVERNSVDIGYQEFDDYLRSSNTEKIKALKSNFPVSEAINIINDLNK
ncbi:S41 family peptidase [Flavobacterium wongokense]|uniref:S41 family peptidase n=1 Tax=Flavobacterium wongokense TaxID=2910674 RepID=UPI001F3B1B26|nr:S41 family peptidase [Flavobacterium sp. WG47]MCF6132250.1 S41 family peptidase [Flavobacterium sp. WG47]